ncbi:hypothetical protein CEXT_726791 [Caerostris extrusa]|uniref:Uncharacterized protein n=1 Tax=Caerostris extrusa TaxID=172846 RepID=A0AAV4YB25_CAEEX|nr:hypothetical protein CEXT_726791 [Caerostris extrusa]
MANLRKQVDRSPSQAEKEDVGVWCRVTKIQSSRGKRAGDTLDNKPLRKETSEGRAASPAANAVKSCQRGT